MNTITIGVDLAKHVFSVCEMDGAGHVLRRFELKREAFVVWLAQVPAGTVVAMEACSGAHHWARVRFIHRSEPAPPVQQDRLRKCSLTFVEPVKH